MLHVRFNVVSGADPAALDDCVGYLEQGAIGAIEEEPGSLGVCLLTEPSRGTAVLQSYWSALDGLRNSEETAEDLRSEMSRRAGGSVAVQEFGVRVFEQEGPLLGGEVARLTRIGVKPAAVDDAIEVFGDTAVPDFVEAEGFCGAMLFADLASGRVVSQTIWLNASARAASPSAGHVVLADMLGSADTKVSPPEDFSLEYTSARRS
jgi:hypothetical protein